MASSKLAQILLVQAQQNEQAAKIIDGLQRLDERLESSAKRWIWELIQNAKDATPGNRKLHIDIHFSSNEVVFKHSGNPFTMKDLISILCQTSMKERQENENEVPETTGKYGTGFITTHLLSRIIFVEGVYLEQEVGSPVKYKRFKLTLDRQPTTKPAMIKKFEESYEVFNQLDKQDSFEFYQIGASCDTSFTYPLNQETLCIAKEGVEDFKLSVFQVLLFNPKIASIKLFNNINGSYEEYSIQSTISLSPQLNLVRVKLNSDERFFCQTTSDNYTSLCVELRPDGQSYQILPKKLKSPIMYVDFPLIGSQEKFTFPCYINSHKFFPNEERSCVHIKDRPCYRTNQEVLLLSVSLYQTLFRYAVLSNWKDIHNLALIGIPNIPNSEWFKSKIMLPIMKEVATAQIIDSNSGKTSLVKVYFPDVERTLRENPVYLMSQSLKREADIFNDLQEVLHPYYSSMLIKKDFEYFMLWKSILHSGWSEVLNQDNYIGICHVLEKIHLSQNLATLRQNSHLYDQTLHWLEQVYKFLRSYITVENRNRYFQQYDLVLNQNNQMSYMGNLYLDDSIEACYKDLCLRYEFNLRDILLTEKSSQTLIELSLNRPKYTFSKLGQEFKTALNHINKLGHARNFSTPFKALERNIKKAVELSQDLIAIVPAFQEVNEREECKKNDHRERMAFYKWAREFYSLRDVKEARDFSSGLYSLCDEIILKQLNQVIQGCTGLVQFMAKFSNYQTQEECIEWLLNFYYYVNTCSLSSLLCEKVILNRSLKFIQVNVNQVNQAAIFNLIERSIAEASQQQQNNQDQVKNLLSKCVEDSLELYAQFLDSLIYDKLIHSKFNDELRRYSLFMNLKQLDIKKLLNGIDYKLHQKLQNVNYYQTNMKEIQMTESMYDLFDGFKNLQSEYLPQFTANYQNIAFYLYSQGACRNSITSITKNGGEQVLNHFGKYNKDQMAKLSQVIEAYTPEKLLGLLDEQERAQIGQYPEQNFSEEEEEEKKIDPQQFLVAHCISNQKDLDNVMKGLTSSQRDTVQSHVDASHSGGTSAFENIMRMLKRAVSNVKAQLSQQPEYDITHWQVATDHVNQNIIGGIMKHGVQVKIVVRPSDYNQIIFHNDTEISTLKESSSELWGDNQIIARQFMFGEIIAWNNLHQFKVFP